MADPNRIAGTAFVTIDGQSQSIVGEATYRVSTETRETLKGMDGVHGYKASPEPGMISIKGRDGGGVSITGLNAAVNATVVLELANGKTIIGRNMWRTGDPIEVNSEDATFELKFEGPDVTEN